MSWVAVGVGVAGVGLGAYGASQSPDTPGAGEQLQGSIEAYRQNYPFLQDAAIQEAMARQSLTSTVLTGESAWNPGLEGWYQRDKQNADRRGESMPSKEAWLTQKMKNDPDSPLIQNVRRQTSTLGTLGQLAPELDRLTQASNTRLRESDLQDVLGDDYDADASMAENLRKVDREANPELFQRLQGMQAPDLAQTNWADARAYQMANQGQRLDTGMRDPTWAAGEAYKKAWQGDQRVDRNLNEIFNYSPEYGRARQQLGQLGVQDKNLYRASNAAAFRGVKDPQLGDVYSQLEAGAPQGQGQASQGQIDPTGQGRLGTQYTRDVEAARSNLLSELGTNIEVSPQSQTLSGEMNEMARTRLEAGGDLTDRDRAAVTEDARSAFQARGRVRDDSAVLGELSELERFRRGRRQEAQQFGQAVEAQNLQRGDQDIRAQQTQGQLNLSRMGLAGDQLSGTVQDRLGAGGLELNRLGQTGDLQLRQAGVQDQLASGAVQRNLAASGAQQDFLQRNIQQNMAFDQDYQDRVDRYLGNQMQEVQFNQAEDQRQIENLWQIEQDWQNRLQNQDQRVLADEQLRRQQMQDYQGISGDWRQREQGDFQNQMAMLGQWRAQQVDPWSSITGRQSANVNRNMPVYGAGAQVGQQGVMGFSDVSNLNNSLTNMGINVDQQQATNWMNLGGSLIGAGGSIYGGAMGGGGT